MAKLINCDMEYFLDYIRNKRIIAFGAGSKFRMFLERFELVDRVDFVVDNDEGKQGIRVEAGGKSFAVRSAQALVDPCKAGAAILITNLAGFLSIMEQINAMPELDGTEVFYTYLMQDNCRNERIEYPQGAQRIPRIIHYCWFGGNPIPEKLQRYMDTWHRYLPDYEIRRWDESNYDVRKNSYMREAYEREYWGFVPDYARLDIVYEHGGIYLDTDVEVVKSFDDMLACKAFFGFAYYGDIATGLGFGAEPGDRLVKELRDYYDGIHFVLPNGEPDLSTCIAHQSSIFQRNGFSFNNRWQYIDSRAIYPMEVLNPRGALHINDLTSRHTHAIHHNENSWFKEHDRQNILNIRSGGWKRYLDTAAQRHCDGISCGALL